MASLSWALANLWSLARFVSLGGGVYTAEPTGEGPIAQQGICLMPIYEFHCASCNKDFDELVQNPKAVSGVKCPTCGGMDVERKISTFSAHATGSPPCGLPSGNACCDCSDPNRPCDL